MAVELAVGYVSIIPETSKIAPTLTKALSLVDRQFDQAGRQSGNRFSQAMANVLTTAGGFLMAKGAMAVGQAVGTAITKGITRYTQIENAQKKLSALGNGTQAIARIMEGANKAVRGTAFGMGEAADVAAAAVASNIKPGTQLDGVLRTIANSAAIAGMDMKSMGAIFNKAAASGKVQGDILAQLGDNGVPAVQWLAKELGVTAGEVYDLGAAGKINFEQFERAMRKGMDPNAAVMMGDTLTGMWANSQAALGRLGAEVMKVLGPTFKDALSSSIERVDALTKMVGPALQNLQGLTGPIWNNVKALASDTWAQLAVLREDGANPDAPRWLTMLFYAFQDLWDRGVALAGSLRDLGAALAPIALDAGKAVAAIGAGIALVAWEAFKAILDVITPLISGLARFIDENKVALEGLAIVIGTSVAAWRAYSLAMGVITAVQFMASAQGKLMLALKAGTAVQWAYNAALSANPIGLVITAIAALVAGVIWAYNNVGWFRDGVNAAWAGIKYAVAAVAGWFTNTLWPGIKAVWDGISSGATSTGSTITSALQTAWDWISGVFMAGWNLLKAWLIDPFINGVQVIIGAFTTIANWALPWVQWFTGVFAAAWGVIQFLVLLPIRLAQLAIEWAWGKITEAFWAAWAWVSGVFMAGWNLVVGWLSGPIDAAKNWISGAWQAITDRFWAAWAWVSGVFMTNWRLLTGLVGTVMESVRSGIDAAWQWITRIFTDAWNWVSGTFRGWWTSFTDLMRGPVEMAKGAIDQILGGIRTAFEQAVNFIRDTWAKVKDAVAAPVKIAIEIGNKLIGGFRGVAEKVGLKIDMPDIPPLPAYAAGTNRVPGSRANGTDSTLAVTSSGMPIARVDPGEGIVRYAAMRSLDRRHPGAFDYINQYGSLPGYAGGGRVHPVPGWPANMGRGFHGVDRGLDIPAPMGTPVVAMRDGTVLSTARWGYSYGNHIRTSDGAIYAHLSQIGVQPGQQITAGQVIGAVGSTGNSFGPHLHVTAYDGASAVGAAINGAMGAGQAIIDWVGDLKGKFAGPLSELGKVGESPVGQFIKAVPKKVADGMVEKIKSAISLIGDSITSTPGDGSRVRWGGGTFDATTAGMLAKAQDALGRALVVTQGSYSTSVKASGSTHSGAGAVDIGSPTDSATEAALRKAGFAAWIRLPGQGPWSRHIHAVANVPGASSSALAQYRDYLRGGDGLGRIGGYWRGTQSARPGLAVVGEQGRELIDFGRGGARVYSNPETEKILGEGVINNYFQPRYEAPRDPKRDWEQFAFEMERAAR